MFNISNKNALRALRTHLTTHGVWIRPVAGLSYVKVLCDNLQEDTPHMWTKEEIESHMEDNDFHSKWNPTRDQSLVTPKPPVARATAARTNLDTPRPDMPTGTAVKTSTEPVDTRWYD